MKKSKNIKMMLKNGQTKLINKMSILNMNLLILNTKKTIKESNKNCKMKLIIFIKKLLISCRNKKIY